MPEVLVKAEPENVFECVLRSDVRLSDDFHDWPEEYRKASDASIEQLLSEHPGTYVISDSSICIDDTSPRFPDADENKGKFFGIRTVKLEQPADSFEASEPGSAAQRLHDFEVEHFGEEHSRHAGQIEKGSGSPFATTTPAWGNAHRAHHAALEALIEAEKEHATAAAAMSAADAKLNAAAARADATQESLA